MTDKIDYEKMFAELRNIDTRPGPNAGGPIDPTLPYPPARTPSSADVIEGMRAALRAAIRVADEAREEWDKAPSGMKAGKLLIALSGHLPGYRSDIDAIHAALALPDSKPDKGGA